MESQNLIISFDYSWFLAKNLAYAECPIMKFHYRNSSNEGDPYYPVPNELNRALYRKYQDLALKEPNVIFVGRLASYKYFNMDEVCNF